MKRMAVTLLTLAGLCAARASVAAERPPANIGHLTCSLGEKVEQESASGSARSVVCVYRSLTNNIEELYVGTAYMTAALGEPGEGDSAISWIVKAPEGATPPSLEQTYTAQANSDSGGDASAALVANKSGNPPSAVELHPLPELSGADSKKQPARVNIAVIELKLKMTTT